MVSMLRAMLDNKHDISESQGRCVKEFMTMIINNRQDAYRQLGVQASMTHASITHACVKIPGVLGDEMLITK